MSRSWGNFTDKERLDLSKNHQTWEEIKETKIMGSEETLGSAFLRWANEKYAEIAKIDDWEEKIRERQRIDRIVRIFGAEEKTKEVCGRCQEDSKECLCCKCDGTCNRCREEEYRKNVL